MKWLFNAQQDFTKELLRLNAIEDLVNHSNLRGKIFKRKSLSPKKIKGLGYFGIAGLAYTYFPYVAL